jgi:hypothetical protein
MGSLDDPTERLGRLKGLFPHLGLVVLSGRNRSPIDLFRLGRVGISSMVLLGTPNDVPSVGRALQTLRRRQLPGLVLEAATNHLSDAAAVLLRAALSRPYAVRDAEDLAALSFLPLSDVHAATRQLGLSPLDLIEWAHALWIVQALEEPGRTFTSIAAQLRLTHSSDVLRICERRFGRIVPLKEAIDHFLTATTVGPPDTPTTVAIVLRGDQLSFAIINEPASSAGSVRSYLEERPALLTAVEERLGIPHWVIREFNDLLNDPAGNEVRFQHFFDRHPRLLNLWPHKHAFSQVRLIGTDGQILIPDYILTDPELARATVLELKSPRAVWVRTVRSHRGYSSLVHQACTQLRSYRDWFRLPANRQSLAEQLGMAVYEPRLAVLIGSSPGLTPELRQSLGTHASDVDVVTYEELLSFARRHVILSEQRNDA